MTAIEAANKAVKDKFALGDYEVTCEIPLNQSLLTPQGVPPDRHEEHSWGRPTRTLSIRAEIQGDQLHRAELVAARGYLEAARDWVKLIQASVPDVEAVINESK